MTIECETERKEWVTPELSELDITETADDDDDEDSHEDS